MDKLLKAKNRILDSIKSCRNEPQWLTCEKMKTTLINNHISDTPMQVLTWIEFELNDALINKNNELSGQKMFVDGKGVIHTVSDKL